MPPLRIAERYIARQLLMPFFAWMLGLLVMLAGSFLFSVIKEAGAQEPPIREILIIVGSKLPGGMVMAIPMAFAFASCLSVNRMSRDGEVVALQVGGLSSRRLAVPIILMGLGASVLTLGVNLTLVPWAADRGREATRLMLHGDPGALAEADLLIEGAEGYLFFARSYDPQERILRHVVVLDRNARGQRQIATAAMGRAEEGVVMLPRVQVTTFDESGRQIKSVEPSNWKVDLGRVLQSLAQEQQPIEDMSLDELLDRAAALRSVGKPLGQVMHAVHMKLALPFATLMFALVAVPIILRYTGSGFMGAMLAIAIIFAYYVMTAWGKVLADAGQVHPAVGGWICTFVFTLVGALLLWRLR